MSDVEVLKKVCLVHLNEYGLSFVEFIEESLIDPYVEDDLIAIGTNASEESGFSSKSERIHDYHGSIERFDSQVFNNYKYSITVEDEDWEEFISFLETIYDSYYL